MNKKSALFLIVFLAVFFSMTFYVNAAYIGVSSPIELGAIYGNERKVADLNGDGYADMLTGTYSLIELINSKNDTFTYGRGMTPTNNAIIWSFDVADIDNDGDLDYLYVQNLYIGWFEQTENGFTEHVIQSYAQGVSRGALTDFNNDGQIDIVIWRTTTSLTTVYLHSFENLGNKTFTERSQLTSTQLAGSITSFKDQADTYPTILMSDGNVAGVFFRSYVWNGAGFDETNPNKSGYVATSVFDTAFKLDLADWDHDGDTDVLILSRDNTIVAEKTANNVYVLHTISTDDNQNIGVFVDLGDDAYLDVATYNNYPTNATYLKFYETSDGTNWTTPFSENVGGRTYMFTIDIDHDSDKDLIIVDNSAAGYARLYKNQLVVAFDLTFLDASGEVFDSSSITPGANIVVPSTNPEKEGYTFEGWFIDENFQTTLPETMPSSATTAYPKYTINTYALSFFDYDGELIETYTLDYQTEISTIALPSDPNRTGYTFAGWDTILENMPSENVSITATYTINQYAITYFDYDGEMILTTELDYQSDLTSFEIPSNPERTGYTFTGWDLDLPNSLDANNLSIHAQYSINSYDVTYVIDGVSTTETVVYNEGLSNIPTLTLEGCEFIEWQLNGQTIDLNNYIQGTEELTFVMIFEDVTAPVIELVNDQITLIHGKSLEINQEDLYTAYDNYDESVDVVFTSLPIITSPGTYEVTLQATDASGNVGEVTLTILVVPDYLFYVIVTTLGSVSIVALIVFTRKKQKNKQ